MRPGLLLLAVAGCGSDPAPRCVVVVATVDPTVYEFGDADAPMVLRAETAACDPEADEVHISALAGKDRFINIADLGDTGRDGDGAAGDGIYERTIWNPFYGDEAQIGEGVVRFEACDPDCREPATEVAIRVDEPPPDP